MNISSFYKILITIFFTISMVGCSFFTQLSPGPVLSELCQAAPTYDVSSRLNDIRQAYVVDGDMDSAKQTMLDMVQDFNCRPNTTLYLSYAFAGNIDGPSRGLGISCVSLGALERWYAQPHFEEWSACDTSVDMHYLIDFNNIVTTNQDINPSLRYQATFVSANQFTKNFFGRLQRRLVIRDYFEFLYEGILFDIDTQDDAQLELGVAFNI